MFELRGSWEAAIGDYHSAEPGLGEGYRAKVLRAWHRLHTKTRAPEPAAATQDDPHVIMPAATVAPIPVYTPSTLPRALRMVLGLTRVLGPNAPAQRKAAPPL